jgi:hypothetical protein
MSIDSANARPVATERQLTVPWLTVVPFALAMAYADGFWMVALRGAVGSIDRSQEPFTTWLRESTLAVPVYLFAVLAALTLAKRWFGPALRTARPVLLTGLMIAAAGTLVGVVQLAISSVYDFKLQSDELVVMGPMHGSCSGTCLDQLQQAQILTLVKAGLIVAGLLLVSNLVLVGWILAMRGGRLNVATSRRLSDESLPVEPASGAGQYAVLVGPRPARTRVDDVRLLLIAGLLCAAHLHVAVIPEHLTKWGSAALLLLLLAAAEVAVAALLLQRQRRVLLAAAVLVALIPLVLWLYGRTAGLPFGPGAGSAQSIGVPGAIAAILELVTLLAALLLLRREGSLRRHPGASAHSRALMVLAIVAVTFIGLAGTALTWFDQPGAADNPSVSHSHTGS